MFLEIFGLSIRCLKDRFEQENLEHYANLQDLLMLAAENLDYDEKLEQVLEFDKDDFDGDNLRAQLQTDVTRLEKATSGNSANNNKQTADFLFWSVGLYSNKSQHYELL